MFCTYRQERGCGGPGPGLDRRQRTGPVSSATRPPDGQLAADLARIGSGALPAGPVLGEPPGNLTAPAARLRVPNRPDRFRCIPLATTTKRCFLDGDRPCDLTCKAAFEVDDPVDNVDCYFVWLSYHAGEGLFELKRLLEGLRSGGAPPGAGPLGGGPFGGFGPGPKHPPKGPSEN